MKSSQGLSRNSILYLLASLFFLVLVIWVLLLSASDLYANQTQNYVNKWMEQEKPPSSSEREEAMDAINTALRIYRGNPEHFRLKALVLEYGTKGKPVWNPKIKPQLQQALLLYKQAIALRPSWPYGWSGMARIKLKLLEIDDEFESALTSMMRLGPWESKINLTVVEFGFITWEKLSNSAQKQVQSAIKRSLINQKSNLYQIAKRYNQEPLVSMLEKQMKR